MRPTIYIPSFNGRERLAALLESLREQTRPADVVVVDNASSDGSQEMVRERYEEVRLIELEQNLGFGTALNRGVAAVVGDPIILLNADVVCPADFLAALLDRASAGAEMVAAVLVSEREPGRIDSAGVIADRTLMAFDYLHGEPADAAKQAPPPLGPTGGAALYRRACFETVGGFDERIFLYYEDVDLALRMRRAGAGCELAGEAAAVHAYSQSLGAGSATKYGYTGWTRGYMLARYGVLGRPRDAARALAAEATICAGQAVVDHTLAGLKGRVRGWRSGRRLPRRQAPADQLLDLSLRQALALRRRRRGSP